MYSDIYVRNQQVFADTRELSCGAYRENTEAMKQGVRVYADPFAFKAVQKRKSPDIIFDKAGTLSAASRYKIPSRRMAVLNFADALTPGGFVLQGEITQEESLCLCTNLYEGLILPQCMEDYYAHNQSLMSQVYSDRIIYSPDVLVFKYDSTLTRIPAPFYVDVITCPAPSCPVSEDVLVKRIRGILHIAGVHKVEQIVLGAWGCGAFGQDANVMGDCFRQALELENYFKMVIFAIREVNSKTDKHNFINFQLGYRQQPPWI